MTWQKPNMKHGIPTLWGWIPLFPDGIELGNNVDIGAFSLLDGKYELVIQDNVKIGSHCAIYTHSTIDNKAGAILIKKNAKIGTHSTIMPGVTIGKNSIVAAHSFVNTDIPDDEIWAGVPAKPLRRN